MNPSQHFQQKRIILILLLKFYISALRVSGMKYKELFYISVLLENHFTRGRMRTVLLLRY